MRQRVSTADPAFISSVLALYDRGKTGVEIAQELGVSRPTAWKTLQQQGCDMYANRIERIRNPDRKLILKLRLKDKMTTFAISRIVGMSESGVKSTVARYLKEKEEEGIRKARL